MSEPSAAMIEAAAPDLLAALKDIVNEIRAYQSPECDEEGAAGAAELKAADAAIAKAEGRDGQEEVAPVADEIRTVATPLRPGANAEGGALAAFQMFMAQLIVANGGASLNGAVTIPEQTLPASVYDAALRAANTAFSERPGATADRLRSENNALAAERDRLGEVNVGLRDALTGLLDWIAEDCPDGGKYAIIEARAALARVDGGKDA
jgi:hypothetical protein